MKRLALLLLMLAVHAVALGQSQQTSVTLRANTTFPLTWQQMDTNFSGLSSAVNSNGTLLNKVVGITGTTGPIALSSGGTNATTAAAALANLGGFPSAGGTLGGPLTVPSLSVTGSPIPLGSGGTGATTATGATSSIQYLQGATGSTARSVTAKLQDTVNVLDFGADPTGATDSTTAFVNAAAALGTNGGTINFHGWFLLNSGLSIPDNVRLRGDWIPGAITNGNFVVSTVTSALIVNPTYGIKLGNRDGVEDALIITTALAPGGSCALPFANATVAASCVSAFSGTAFAPNASSGTFNDHRLENLLVLGFNYTYLGGSTSPAQVLSRPVFRRIYGDTTNGISVQNVGDTGRAEDLHFWPFTTVDLANAGNTSLFYRTGTAFYTGPASTWMKWDDADEFGYAFGHVVNGSNNVHQTHCGADSTGSNTSVGFLYQGSISFTECDHCTITGQGDTGFRLAATTGAGYTGILLTSPIANGNNSTNGYIDIQSGNYAISNGLFTDNSSVGHIKLESGAGAGAIVNPIFANNAGNPAVFGDATALSKMQLINPTYAGTSSSQLPNSLANLNVAGALNASGVSTLSGTTYLGGVAGSNSAQVVPIANAVNRITLAGAATSARPLIQAAGSDANVGLSIATQGTGAEFVVVDGGNGRSFAASNVGGGTVANYLYAHATATGVAPNLTATGTDTNVSVNIVPKGTGTFQVNGANVLPNLTGTTGSIGGSALAAGACTSGTVAVTNSTTAMAVSASPVTYPGDGIFWHGYVSATGTVTVKVCASVAATPTASAYNVRVLQ